MKFPPQNCHQDLELEFFNCLADDGEPTQIMEVDDDSTHRLQEEGLQGECQSHQEVPRQVLDNPNERR
jgi:hypothetical protein